MCSSDAFTNPLKRLAKPKDALQMVSNKMVPLGLPAPQFSDFEKRKKKAAAASSPFGGYVSAYDQKTALGS
jgi:hypothetical protein